MQYRNMHSNSSNSFSTWLAQSQQQSASPPASSSSSQKNPSSSSYDGSLFGQLGAIRDSFANQLEGLSGALPEAGPLSAAFRERLTWSLYLLLGAAAFGALAVLVGLPTLALRPSKFVLCLSLCTLLAASSVVVLQKPTVFLSSLMAGGWSSSSPVLVLFLSQMITLYITVFIHRYVYVLVAAGVQVVCLLFYLASFVPGGAKGLQLLLRMLYAVISTAITPCFYVAKGVAAQCMRSLCA